MTDITVIILTKNEELNIARAINSVKAVADRICVVDSGSTDKTVEIARSLGAEVVEHPFVTHGQQFNWAMNNLNITTKWIFRLDADEEVTSELAQEIIEKTALHTNDDVSAFEGCFKVYFLGKFLKYGGVYPFKKIVLFKTGKGYIDEAGMRDHPVILEGRIQCLTNDFLHYDFKSMDAWIQKHNWYSSLEVKNLTEDTTDANGKRTATAEKAIRMRNGFYYKLPRYWRARLYYWYRYYFKLGFLDGEAGRVHAFLQAYWYRYLIDAKLFEEEVRRRGK